MGLFLFVFGLSLIYNLRHLQTPNSFLIPSWVPGVGGRDYIYGLAVIPLFFGAIIPILEVLRLRRTWYIVTDQRVEKQRTVLSKSTTGVLRTQVREAFIHQSFLEKLIRVGDIEVRTELDPQGVMMFKDVLDPGRFYEGLFRK